MTSIKTFLQKTTRRCSKLVELYLTMTSLLQVICLREVPKMKQNPINDILPTSRVLSILARLLHQRQGLIVFFMMKLTDQSSLLEAAMSGQNVICMLRDDTDVFVLLAYWVNRTALQCKVHMERWHGSVLDINAICADPVQECLQLLCMHELSVCDTTSYLTAKEMSLQ